MNNMMGSFAEQPSIRFYIGSTPKRMIDVSGHALGFRFDSHPRSWQIAAQQAIGLISEKDPRTLS